ncbi:hypothetical protein HKX48_000788 [Thoreauomyces humboldtii]|nr:hypothetical protein HKX48_000788 [Thoreauomyces humboldtii]
MSHISDDIDIECAGSPPFSPLDQKDEDLLENSTSSSLPVSSTNENRFLTGTQAKALPAPDSISSGNVLGSTGAFPSSMSIGEPRFLTGGLSKGFPAISASNASVASGLPPPKPNMTGSRAKAFPAASGTLATKRLHSTVEDPDCDLENPPEAQLLPPATSSPFNPPAPDFVSTAQVTNPDPGQVLPAVQETRPKATIPLVPVVKRRPSVRGSGISLDSFRPSGDRTSVTGSSSSSFDSYVNKLLVHAERRTISCTGHGPPTIKHDGFVKAFPGILNRTFLSINGMVLMLFCFSILASNLFLGIYQTATYTNSINALAIGLQLGDVKYVVGAINDEVETIQAFARLHRDLFEVGALTMAHFQETPALFWKALDDFSLPDMYLTMNILVPPYYGNVYGVEHIGTNLWRRWSAPNNTYTREDFWDDLGNPVTMPGYPLDTETGTVQDWVSQLLPLPHAIQAQGYWTGITIYLGEVYFSFGIPLYDTDGTTIKYTLGADFNLAFLNGVLKATTARSTIDADLAIFDINGMVVSTTISGHETGSYTTELESASASSSDVLQNADTQLRLRTPDHTYFTMTETLVVSYTTNEGEYSVAAAPFMTDTGMQMIILQIVARSEIFGDIDKASRATAGIVAGTTLALVALAVYLLHRITEPLFAIKEAMNALFDVREDPDETVSGSDGLAVAAAKDGNHGGKSGEILATAAMDGAHDPEQGVPALVLKTKVAPAKSFRGTAADSLKLKKLSRLTEISELQLSFLKMKETIKAFEKFVPPVVVRRIILREKKAKDLYVEKKEVAIFFSDIADFTSIAERMPSEVLISMLAQYFQEMTRSIEKSQGVLCDFIGDGIMIFWNAPHPLEDFATKALTCALDQQARVLRLNASFRSQGWPEFNVRMGVHVGVVHAGNIGSKYRMKLGIVGDNVNLSSRLEALNKRYSSRLIISGECRNRLANHAAFVMRPLEHVIVKGRVASVEVYEVFGASAKASQRTKEMVKDFGVVHQMLAGAKPDRMNKREKDVVLAACDEYLAKYPKDQAGILLREKVVHGIFGAPVHMSENFPSSTTLVNGRRKSSGASFSKKKVKSKREPRKSKASEATDDTEDDDDASSTSDVPPATNMLRNSLAEMRATVSEIHLYGKQRKRASVVAKKAASMAGLKLPPRAPLTIKQRAEGVGSVGSTPTTRVAFPRCGPGTTGKGADVSSLTATTRLVATPMVHVESDYAANSESLMGSLKNRRDLRRRLQEHAAELRDQTLAQAAEASLLLERTQKEAARLARLQRRAEIIFLNNMMRFVEEQSWKGGMGMLAAGRRGSSNRDLDLELERSSKAV